RPGAKRNKRKISRLMGGVRRGPATANPYIHLRAVIQSIEKWLARLLFLRRVPRPHFEPDRRALEPERLADLVLEEPLKAEMQLDIAVGEENECWRRYSRLRHVEDVQPLGHRNRRTLKP